MSETNSSRSTTVVAFDNWNALLARDSACWARRVSSSSSMSTIVLLEVARKLFNNNSRNRPAASAADWDCSHAYPVQPILHSHDVEHKESPRKQVLPAISSPVKVFVKVHIPFPLQSLGHVCKTLVCRRRPPLVNSSWVRHKVLDALSP